MTKHLRIATAQLNLTVGDFKGNLQKHIDAAIEAVQTLKADIIVFPELSLSGYPPEDLLFRNDFLDAANDALDHFTKSIKDIYCLVSHPLKHHDGIFNACSLIYNGKIIAQYAKQSLPNYGVFDEKRYFISGDKTCVVDIKGVRTGLIICEDLWSEGPIKNAVAQGAELILVPNASPFESDKHELRFSILNKRAKENHVPIVYVNNIGGQDELVFDGGSMIVDEEGGLQYLAPFFKEDIHCFELAFNQKKPSLPIFIPNEVERIYQALVIALRDYVTKNNAPGVLLGLSGGIDSALTLCIAVDALGKDRVKAIALPSRYTSQISYEDAEALAKNLGVNYQIISIEPSYESFISSLAANFAGLKPDLTEENLQARCRAVILMALSNKTGYLVLSTSNRSESAVGYSTLYGDMVGGFAVLKDVLKTMVYKLAKYRNEINHVIPERTIERAPSAELAPDQKDEDSLPPYPILDRILQLYLDQGRGIDEITKMGFDRETVAKVAHLIRQSEYKRRQAPIGPRINQRSFGKDWRFPVTNKFRG